MPNCPRPRIRLASTAALSMLITHCLANGHVGLSGQIKSSAKEIHVNFNAMQSRVGQNLPHIEFEGLRYKEVINGTLLDLPQRTGYMVVMDANTQARVALIKIYDTPLDPNLEADVQDVFFTLFELRAEQREILIVNERGARFVFEIDSKLVRPIP